MKLLFGKSKKEPEVKRQQDKIVLFVCVENAGRSQIAEALFRKYAPRGYIIISGGTRPAREINPIVVQAMNAIGIDISKQKSKVAILHWLLWMELFSLAWTTFKY